MAEIWTTPKTWALDDVFEASVANVHLRDNLEYLFNKPKAYFTTDYAVDEAFPTVWTHKVEYDLQLTTETGVIEYNAAFYIDGGVWGKIDVYIPELNIWLSSGTATQLTNGLAWRDSGATGYDVPIIASIIRNLQAAGSYTFELWHVGQTAACKFMANIAQSVHVKEV